MSGKLTDALLRGLKPTGKLQKLSDGDGLFLFVLQSGGMSWRYLYRFDGKQKTYTIGRYPDISLKAARLALAEARKTLANGLDPSDVRKENRSRAETEEKRNAQTFEVVGREWFTVKMAEKNEKYRSNIVSYLENVLFPAFGTVPIAELKRSDIVPCLQAKAESGAVETSHRIASVASQICAYALEKELCPSNVASGISKVLPEVHHRQRNAITDPKAVGQLLRDIDAYPSGTIVHTALRLMAYTFVRSNELRGAKWNELDLEGAIWVIPAQRMKGRLELMVPLSKQSLALFNELKKCTGNGEFCFPSHSKEGYITEGSLRQPLKRLGYSGVQDVHGFRGIASTLLNEQLKIRSDVIERQLAHIERNEVRRAYNRSLYIEERTEMMQRYADFLDSLRAQA